MRNKVTKGDLFIELVDKTGERKFVKTKLDQEGKEYLSDRGTYYLCTLNTATEEEEVEPLVH